MGSPSCEKNSTTEPIQLIPPSVPQVKPSATSRMSRATIHACHPMNFS